MSGQYSLSNIFSQNLTDAFASSSHQQSDIGNMTKLEGTADFSHNLFSGLIPPSIGDLPEKVYVDLSYNNLSGPIPQNGTMVNRGPNVFIGNPLLCGPPSKEPCSDSMPPNGADNSGRSSRRVSMRKCVIVAIVVSDLIGEEGVLVFYERRFMVPLDPHVKFNLDELLKASAIALGKTGIGIGIVYKVVLDSRLNLVVQRLGEGGMQRFKEFKRDVEAVGKVRHPNIVTLRAYYWSVEKKLLIYDYIPNGNLSTAIHGRAETFPFSPLPWALRLKRMKGIARGLCFLHEFSPKKYVHGNT
ncbi:hypothetical protein J5N97_007551 [Dioscorea zingiberensis]|uniref:Protein kinase domain-containing protein n=1 Tax=Dioscorea zingiberensis TaxID=325984 RepID=A0A9D5DCH2_9LILI|nr:hypothetical protein J5N97_007551 [Dioscorea zingiberensis]